MRSLAATKPTRTPLKLKPKPAPMERHEQEEYFYWIHYLRYHGDRVSDFTYAIPNGAYYGSDRKRAAIQAAYLLKQGMKRGVPDVCVAIAATPYHGLYIEFKRIGAPAPQAGDDQYIWHARLRKQGYYVAVCHGFEEAKAVTLEYLNPSAIADVATTT